MSAINKNGGATSTPPQASLFLADADIVNAMRLGQYFNFFFFKSAGYE